MAFHSGGGWSGPSAWGGGPSLLSSCIGALLVCAMYYNAGTDYVASLLLLRTKIVQASKPLLEYTIEMLNCSSCRTMGIVPLL